MVNKRTHSPPDSNALLPLKFQEFVQYFPDAALDKAKIKRAQFVGVSMMLSRHGDFPTGTRIRPSIGTLADEAGVSKPTVRKVLAFLQQMGVLEAVGLHRNPGGGSPVTEYRLRRIKTVDDVLRVKDRDLSRGKQETTAEATGSIGEPLSSNWGTAQGQLGNHNRNHQEKKRTNSDESSSAPSTPLPSAGGGAAAEKEQEDSQWYDSVLSEIGSLPMEKLLHDR